MRPLSEVRQNLAESRRNPFKSPVRAGVFGAVLGGSLGFGAGEMVNKLIEPVLFPAIYIPPAFTAGAGATAMGIGYCIVASQIQREERINESEEQ